MTARSEREPRSAETPELAALGMQLLSLLHELRQPLFAIKGHAEMIAAEATSDSAVRHAAAVLRQVEHIEGLMTSSRGERRGPSEAPVELRRVVDEVAHMLQPKFEAHDVTLALHQAQMPCLASIPETAARQVMINLLDNALRAVSSCATKNVVVSVTSEADVVVLRVTDSGCGLPVGDTEHLFEAFVTSKSDGVSGLGLYVTRQLVRDAGGEITIEALSAGGAQAVVTLPGGTPVDP